MKARRPELNFAETPPHWADNPEFAQSFNASSLWIPHLERFLNRVMTKALTKIKDSGAVGSDLRSEVRTFIRQESNHIALHSAFNEILPRAGYDLARFEAIFEAEFQRLFETKSIAFLTAYCEGFETFGPPSALVWLNDEIGPLLKGARPEVVDLWKWHLLEEYEHRTVCHDVYHAVHGGYFLRIYGFFFQMNHLGGFTKMVREYLLATDRAAMTPAELKASKRREKAAARKIMWLTLPRLIKVLSPFYTPRNAKEPSMFRDYMAFVESTLVAQ